MAKRSPQKKTCQKGHVFYKSSDCPTCPVCEQEKTPAGVFADMSVPVRRALDHAGITTLKQLSKKTEKEILALHGVGPASMPTFKKKLKIEGLSFRSKETET